jgi:DNA-directed RNA polymerase specialized sigma24 family protein
VASRLGHAHARVTTAEPEQRIADRAALFPLLARLPRTQRQAVMLRFLDDLSERDTAAAMGVSVGAVKSYPSRGLAALRSRMADEAA